MTPHNRAQKVARLEREIAHFERQIKRFSAGETPQDKRRHTTAVRCLNDRKRQLEKVVGE